MYAVIETGGKQYKVTEGQVMKFEKLADCEAGQSIEFDRVLLVAQGENIQIGTPYLPYKVTATVVGHGRGEKIRIVKHRRRKHYHREMGHRQHYTEVTINHIGS